MHRIIARDSQGNPIRVHEDNGFMETCHDFDPDKDGWIEQQLDVNDFPIISMGRQMQALIYEVNTLRRENFQLKKNEERYLKACKL